MRLIDADVLLKRFELTSEANGNAIRYEIRCTPTVDAEPVVRCKDCGEYQTKNRPFPRCRITGRMRGANDYCSDGYTGDGE